MVDDTGQRAHFILVQWEAGISIFCKYHYNLLSERPLNDSVLFSQCDVWDFEAFAVTLSIAV